MSFGPIMMDIQGTALEREDKELLMNPLIGGLIYFARNFSSVEQITNLCAEIRSLRPDILLAVDQEGGRVQRFQEGFTRLPPMQRFLPLYHKKQKATLSLVQECGWLMAVELLSVGLDFSFAPVLDVDDHHCPVIADRAFSHKPDEVVLLAGAFMQGMHEAGMAVTGKHFPGHGSVSEDSHQELPRDNRSLLTLQQHDMIPFTALMKTLDAIMPAHIVFPQIDTVAVGFSSYWLQQILRQQLGFNGVIFSDDLSMEGATSAGHYGQRVQAALSAGCDMALICNNRAGIHQALHQLTTDNNDLLETRNDSISRLQGMQATSLWSRSLLAADERYIKTRERLSVLM